jgi:hypothetical protein
MDGRKEGLWLKQMGKAIQWGFLQTFVCFYDAYLPFPLIFALNPLSKSAIFCSSAAPR